MRCRALNSSAARIGGRLEYRSGFPGVRGDYAVRLEGTLQFRGSVFRKFLSAIGFGAGAGSVVSGKPPYVPYGSDGTNVIYNLLFCDDLASFKPKPDAKIVPWQTTLFAEPLDFAALELLASDASQEGRSRYLAYTLLRNADKPIPDKILLGVIVEVGLADGLDVLAAFSEGGVRYINKTGKVAVFEGVPEIRPVVQAVLDAAQPIVGRTGPWPGARLAPPRVGNIRITFLVSDGLYFGQGPMTQMQQESMAAPLIQKATVLLQAVVALAGKSPAPSVA